MSAESAPEGSLGTDILGREEDDDLDWSGVGSFLQMLDRLVTVLRVYPKHHPVVDGVADRCRDRLARLHEHTDWFEVFLTPTEIVNHQKTPLFSRELSENDRFVWYESQADGLVSVVFREGVTSDELQQLMGVIEQIDGGSITSDDDAITLLWEKQFDHIGYQAIDSFIDKETLEEFNDRTPREVVEMMVGAALYPGGDDATELSELFHAVGIEGLDWFTRARVKETFEQKSVQLSEDDIAYALGVDRDVVGGLLEEWGRGGDLEVRFIEALLSVIRTSPNTEAAERAREMIISITVEMIDKEMYLETVKVLSLLHERAEVFPDPDDNPLMDAVNFLSDPMQVEALLWRMQKSPRHRDAICDLLPLLDKDLVQGQLINILSDENKDILQPGLLVDMLLATSTPENVNRPAEGKLLESATYLRRIVESLAGRKQIEAWPPSRRILKTALRSKWVDIRAAALDVDFIGWKQDAFARTTLVPLIDDSDEELRRRALQLLKRHHPEILRDALRREIAEGGLKGRPRGEVRMLFTEYVENNRAGLDDLVPLLDTKGWFGEGSRAVAEVAAHVLVEERHEEGTAKVEEMVDNFWVSGKLKTTFRRILKTYGPREEESVASESSGDDEETA